MSVASRAASLSSLMTFLRDGIDSYSSAKSSSTATPSLLFGRSRMCPIEATTLKSRPRYLLMVFAFAGDSTTTSALAIDLLIPNPYALHLTVARSSNPHESAAARPRHETSHFEIEEPRQQARCREPGPLRDRVEIARLAGRQRVEHRIGRGRESFSGTVTGKKTPDPLTELLQDIVRGLHNLCTVAQQRMRAPVAAA